MTRTRLFLSLLRSSLLRSLCEVRVRTLGVGGGGPLSEAGCPGWGVQRMAGMALTRDRCLRSERQGPRGSFGISHRSRLGVGPKLVPLAPDVREEAYV